MKHPLPPPQPREEPRTRLWNITASLLFPDRQRWATSTGGSGHQRDGHRLAALFRRRFQIPLPRNRVRRNINPRGGGSSETLAAPVPVQAAARSQDRSLRAAPNRRSGNAPSPELGPKKRTGSASAGFTVFIFPIPQGTYMSRSPRALRTRPAPAVHYSGPGGGRAGPRLRSLSLVSRFHTAMPPPWGAGASVSLLPPRGGCRMRWG